MQINNLEKILKALANRRRLAIIGYLYRKKIATVSDIARKIDLSFRSTSKHLAILSAADIVAKDQRGRFVYYKIGDTSILNGKIRDLL
jgi:DNA-binding transcriptional ArsR family regulator